MKVVIAIDSFKGSMTSLEAGESAAAGIRRVYPDADIRIRPLADGGEGTVDALTMGCGGRLQKIRVTGPLGRPVDSVYGILEESRTAIIEMSSAAGITLISEKERNPLLTTTYGVGEMIRDAIEKGCRHFIIGIGGSSTNDGGIGMLQALGFGILDQYGKPVCFGASGLEHLARITDIHVMPELKDCTFRIACDVTNPLCGEQGCSAIFGPQKGASPAMILQMDKWLLSYVSLAKNTYPDADPEYPGTGAAGGLGFALQTFLHATLESGIKIILEETRLEDYVKSADVVITGEGRLDEQTVMGKAPIGVARIAKTYNIPVLAFSGCITRDAAACNQEGIDAFFPILPRILTFEEAMDTENARYNMTHTTEQVFRVIHAFVKGAVL